MTECVISIVTKSNDLVHVLPSVIHLLYVKRSKALPLLALLACPKKKKQKKKTFYILLNVRHGTPLGTYLKWRCVGI